MISASLTAVTLFLVVVTVLPLRRFEAWWIRSLDFPRFQFSILAVCLTVLEIVLLDFSLIRPWILLLFCTACLAYQFWWIAPYTPLFPAEVPSAAEDGPRRIRILTANVLTPNRQSEPLVNLVRENAPDLLVTLESDEWWQSRLDALEPDGADRALADEKVSRESIRRSDVPQPGE